MEAVEEVARLRQEIG
jgi:hypothetical protein